MGFICYLLIQMNEPIETSELLAFARTVEAQSLSRAARDLRVPRATISRRLARLEERLGVRLLRRTTRSLVLTDAGEILYRHASTVLGAVRDAEESVRRKSGAVSGELRVSLPPMNDPSLYALLCDFAATYPDVRLQLDFSPAYADIVGGRADVAMRASIDLDPGLVARTLGRSRMVAVASPAYLKKAGTPKRITDLARHACLMGYARGGVPDTHWPLLDGKKIRVDGAIHSNDIGFLREAVLLGRGIAMLPLLVIAVELRSGAMVPVLERTLGATSRISVVYADKEFVAPAVRAFVDTVAEWAKDRFRHAAADEEECRQHGAKKGRARRADAAE